MITHTLGLFKCSYYSLSYIKAFGNKTYNTLGAVKFRKVSTVRLAMNIAQMMKLYLTVSYSRSKTENAVVKIHFLKIL